MTVHKLVICLCIICPSVWLAVPVQGDNTTSHRGEKGTYPHPPPEVRASTVGCQASDVITIPHTMDGFRCSSFHQVIHALTHSTLHSELDWEELVSLTQ